MPWATARWTIRNDPNAPGETTSLSVAESPQQWIVSTGPARFTVKRMGFNGLSKVERTTGTPITISEITGAIGSAGFIQNRGGMKSTHMPPWYLVMERRGPQVVTIAARGYYGTGPTDRDLEYTIRMHFYAGSSVVNVDHRFLYGDVDNFGAGGATNTTTIDATVIAKHIQDHPRPLILIFQMRGVYQDLLIVFYRDFEVLDKNRGFVFGILVQADFTNPQHIWAIEEVRDQRDYFAR